MIKILVKNSGGMLMLCRHFKCGNCLRGNVAATVGYRCRVCGCSVAEVLNILGMDFGNSIPLKRMPL